VHFARWSAGVGAVESAIIIALEVSGVFSGGMGDSAPLVGIIIASLPGLQNHFTAHSAPWVTWGSLSPCIFVGLRVSSWVLVAQFKGWKLIALIKAPKCIPSTFSTGSQPHELESSLFQQIWLFVQCMHRSTDKSAAPPVACTYVNVDYHAYHMIC